MKIYNDVFNISKRIKYLNKNYYIVFNTSKNKFEVHDSSLVKNTYCLTLPYNQLDERALKYVLSTRCEYVEEILNKIEINNKKLESANKKSSFSNLIDNFKNLE